MKLVGKNKLSGVLEYLTWVLIAVSAGSLAALHWIVTWMMELNVNSVTWDESFWYPRYMITLGASALLALLILWQARRILHNANNGTVFSLSTVRCMRILGIEVLIGALFYVVMLFCGMTKFAVGLLALVFALAGMIVLVFSELFVQAINYKQENDMTI